MARENKFADEQNHEALASLLITLLLDMGYEIIEPRQKRKDVIRLALEAPRPIEGSELGLHCYANGHRAIVWTSWVPELQKFRDVGTDIFWSIITNNDQLVYCAKPFNRIDEDAVINLARQAWISKWKIENLPLDELDDCNARMQVHRTKKGGYCYICKKRTNHANGKNHSLPWDYQLPSKAKEFLQIRRDATALYKKICKERGIVPTPKRELRKRWKSGKPQNFIPKSV